MADVRISKSGPESEQHPQRSEGQRALLRRREYFPSLFNVSPAEFFSASPFSLMRRITEEMDRAFSSWADTRGGEAQRQWIPPIELYEEDNKLKVRAELPGMDKDNVKVEVSDGQLIIQGERKQDQQHERGGIYHSERTFGRFYRSIALPEDAKTDEAQAEYRNGVLEITVPVTQSSARKPRQIPISGEIGMGGKKTQAA